MTDAPTPSPRTRKRITRALSLPLVSGKSSAFVLLGALVLSALAIPLGAKLPVWVEFEIVLAVWWAAWVATLAHLLYHGRRVSDDYAWRSATSWFAGQGTVKGHVAGEAGRGKATGSPPEAPFCDGTGQDSLFPEG